MWSDSTEPECAFAWVVVAPGEWSVVGWVVPSSAYEADDDVVAGESEGGPY